MPVKKKVVAAILKCPKHLEDFFVFFDLLKGSGVHEEKCAEIAWDY